MGEREGGQGRLTDRGREREDGGERGRTGGDRLTDREGEREALLEGCVAVSLVEVDNSLFTM